MTSTKSLKLIIPWIVNACDSDYYPELMYWIDKPEKVFFVSWIHKSSEYWNESMSRVFEDWAAIKKNLGEKDARDLKAAFRNALHSKGNLRLVKKEKHFQHWQILDISFVENSIPSGKNNNKVIKPKQKRRPEKNTREFNSKKITIEMNDNLDNDGFTMNASIPIISNFNQPSIPPCTLNNDSVLHSSPLSSYNSMFSVSLQTPSQPTDVPLQSLAEQSEFFGFQEFEKISSFPYIAPSPYVIPSGIKGIQETDSKIPNVNNDIRTHSLMSHEHQHPNFSFPDFSFIADDKVKKEQIVPAITFQMGNEEFNLEQLQLLYETQLDSKEPKEEFESVRQLRPDQNSMYNLIPEDSLNARAEFMPNLPALFNDMEGDIYRCLWDTP